MCDWLQIDIAGHKLSTLEQNEDSEILRVPIAMAMTKLLLALPQDSLHTHLPRSGKAITVEFHLFERNYNIVMYTATLGSEHLLPSFFANYSKYTANYS